jgi:hypothetical protein
MRSSFPFLERRSFGAKRSLDDLGNSDDRGEFRPAAAGPDIGGEGRARPVEQAIGIALLACAVDTVLHFFLYFRASPSGVAFAMDPYHYVFHAAYYGAWAICLATLPFLALAILRARRGRPPSAWAELVQASLFGALLLVGSVDRECQRFLGMHISASWVQTYGALHRTPTVIWDTLQQDKGGAYSALVGLGASLLFVPLSLLMVRLVPAPAFWKRRRSVQLACALLLVWPTILWNFIPGGGQRQAKVRPALFLVWREATLPRVTPPSVEALRASTAAFQSHWRALDATQAWEFADTDYPLRKHFAGAAPAPARRPNIILLSLETFRAKDMRSMNPALEIAPTPFLDRLAQQPNSAYFERYYTNGIPTVYAFIAMHASLLPHPRRGIHNEATTQNIEAFHRRCASTATARCTSRAAIRIGTASAYGLRAGTTKCIFHRPTRSGIARSSGGPSTGCGVWVGRVPPSLPPSHPSQTTRPFGTRSPRSTSARAGAAATSSTTPCTTQTT